jgi:hypothetical protein
MIDDLPSEWAGTVHESLGRQRLHVLARSGRHAAQDKPVPSPGAVLGLTQQPRGGNVTGAEELREPLREAGFTGIVVRRLALDPPAVCVLGRMPVA